MNKVKCKNQKMCVYVDYTSSSLIKQSHKMTDLFFIF